MGNGDHAEPAVLAQLESDHILKVYHAESINKDDAFFMTQYCTSGDLDDALKSRKFGTVEAIDVLSQIAGGASFLHGNGYLHRDLKPANIFCLSKDKFVIGDFGSVVVQNDEGYAKTLTRHSLLYRPPEELEEKRSYREGDIYQLGMIFYQLLGGHLPYEERAWLSEKEAIKYDGLGGWEQQNYATSIIESKIVRDRVVNRSTLPAWVPAGLKTVVRRCCATKREDRYSSVADLVVQLNNLRSTVPEWRVGENPILHRGKRRFRIVPHKGSYVIEKCIGAQWRKDRTFLPETLFDAVKFAEQL
ncbi:serine/threonine protein kinase [Phyllobacterium ifriqiyense]|nr:protein kinase [Phyllobacterium ifriqiyense]